MLSHQTLRTQGKPLALFADIEGELQQVEAALASVLATRDRLIGDVSAHLLRTGGKRIRPALVLLCAKFPGAQIEQVIPVAVAVELIHMATLVHDDVVDHATVRRGLPTVNVQWSNQVSVLTGDYLFARAFSLLASTGRAEVFKSMADVVFEMSRGELVQIASCFDTEQTEADYLQRIGQKTAYLIAESCRVGALVAGAPPAQVQGLYEYGLNVGYSFQIADDLLDLTGTPGETGKPVGEDLRAGILTLPVLHALSQGDRQDVLKAIISRQTLADADMAAVKDELVAAGSLEYARNQASAYLARAMEQLAMAADLTTRDTLHRLAEFVVNRQF